MAEAGEDSTCLGGVADRCPDHAGHLAVVMDEAITWSWPADRIALRPRAILCLEFYP